MDKIKIGIPRSMFYYYYGELFKNFFENLDFEVVISPLTNKEIMELGKKYAYDEMCLSLKNYIGHVCYLKDKCDYILVPRIDNFGISEQTCTNFLAAYDIINNLFDVKLINYNIDYLHNKKELDGFIKMAKELKINRYKANQAYIKAKVDEMNLKDRKIRENINNLEKDNLKILVVSHPYNMYDNVIGKPILDLLKKENVTLIYSDLFNTDRTSKLSKNLSKNLYFKYNKENIGSILYVRDKVDGIVFLTTFPCGPDSLVNELVIRKIKLPYLNLIVDDLDNLSGFETRIESFIDMIKERRKNEENSVSYDG